MSPPEATVGVVEHGNSAVLVTVAGGELLDRRRVDLTEGMTTHPHHHEGSWAVGRYVNIPGARVMTMAEVVALVERVRVAAEQGARACLAQLPGAVGRIAIRICPELPATVEERIRDSRAQTYADSVMYRRAVATAAAERGWTVCWYDRARVFQEAAKVLGRDDIDGVLHSMGRKVGPPWQAAHKLATAAAIACAR